MIRLSRRGPGLAASPFPPLPVRSRPSQTKAPGRTPVLRRGAKGGRPSTTCPRLPDQIGAYAGSGGWGLSGQAGKALPVRPRWRGFCTVPSPRWTDSVSVPHPAACARRREALMQALPLPGGRPLLQAPGAVRGGEGARLACWIPVTGSGCHASRLGDASPSRPTSFRRYAEGVVRQAHHVSPRTPNPGPRAFDAGRYGLSMRGCVARPGRGPHAPLEPMRLPLQAGACSRPGRPFVHACLCRAGVPPLCPSSSRPFVAGRCSFGSTRPPRWFHCPRGVRDV